MFDLVVSRRAENDLQAIWTYIALNNAPAADRLLTAIDDRIRRLRRFSGLGRPRDDVRPGARSLAHGNYLILYEIDADQRRVEIVAIVAAMRDLPQLF